MSAAVAHGSRRSWRSGGRSLPLGRREIREQPPEGQAATPSKELPASTSVYRPLLSLTPTNNVNQSHKLLSEEPKVKVELFLAQSKHPGPPPIVRDNLIRHWNSIGSNFRPHSQILFIRKSRPKISLPISNDKDFVEPVFHDGAQSRQIANPSDRHFFGRANIRCRLPLPSTAVRCPPRLLAPSLRVL